MILRADIEQAAAAIAPYVRRTPVIEVWPGLTLKLECLQHAGSFKPRGAFWSVLSAPERPKRLLAASGGNHGLAVAHVGAALGIRTRIFVPTIASPVKVAGIRRLGAEVVQVGATYAEALAAARAEAEGTGVLSLHAYDSPATVTGQGTVGLEFVQQAELDTVVVAVGGGGLAGGVAAAVSPEVRVVAVETEGCATYAAARAAGAPSPVTPTGVAADALGASLLGKIAWSELSTRDVESVLVTDSEALAARSWLWRELRLIAEPAGAVALAAVLNARVAGERIGVVVCGANTDPSDLEWGAELT